MFPSFLNKKYRSKKYQFWIRQRPAQTTADDATLMAKALCVLPAF